MIQQKNNHRIRKGVFVFFIAVLLLPFVQSTLPLVKELPLDGVDPRPPALPDFTWESWFNEEYQKAYGPVSEQRVGFRPSLVRIKNQVNYSLFDYSDVPGIVFGKNGMVYVSSYTNAYLGKDFAGIEHLRIQTEKLQLVQRELKKKNIDLFVALAPGKGSFYPENIPDDVLMERSDSTNYDYDKMLFAEKGINTLDLRSYFLSIKKTEKYPLYCSSGVHWTQYGAYLAGKQIVSYLEKLRNCKLTGVKLDSVSMMKPSGSGPDYDAAALLNIWNVIPYETVAIPHLSFTRDSATVKPRFVCIGDSYFSMLPYTNIPPEVFSDYHYWLYFDRIYPESHDSEIKIGTRDLKKELEKNDVICLMATDATLALFPYGFADQAYEIYSPKDAAYYDLKRREHALSLQTIIRHIFESREWKAALEKEAKSKNISPEEQFMNTAKQLYLEEQAKMIPKNSASAKPTPLKK